MSILCGSCGAVLDDFGNVLVDDQDEKWCDTCEDMRVFSDGCCTRCGEPDSDL